MFIFFPFLCLKKEPNSTQLVLVSLLPVRTEQENKLIIHT